MIGDLDTAGACKSNYVDSLPHGLALVTAGTLGYYRGLGVMSRPVGAGNLLAAAEYLHADGPWTIPGSYNKGNLVLSYSQGNALNGFSFMKLPITFVVFNNGGYRIIKQRLKLFHRTKRFIGMDFVDPPIEFAALALALDVQGRRVETPAAFRTAMLKLSRPPSRCSSRS